MEYADIIGRLNVGMPVWTADGKKLGTIAELYCGSDRVDSTGHRDDEHCTHLEVHAGLFGSGLVLFIPVDAVASVADKHVRLTMDTTTVHDQGNWIRRPPDDPKEERFDVEHEAAGIAAARIVKPS
jgi:hypothetical protein